MKPQSLSVPRQSRAYQVPTISYVTKTTVTYTVDGRTPLLPPPTPGLSRYRQLHHAAGTAALEPVTSTLTITKVEQNVPAAPMASNIGTNCITVAAIPGAYSPLTAAQIGRKHHL